MKTNKIIIEPPKVNRLKYTIKLILAPFLNLFYHVVILLNRPKYIEKRYKVSICCIFKNEAKYLKEWLEYHLLIGIEHFYLYNNFSDDQYMDILNPYISKDLITLIDWPVKQGQMPAYKHWHDNFRNETGWVSFLDVDEFICPYYEENIYNWISKFKNYPSVLVYWKMFGTSGIIDSDSLKLVTEQYTISWDRFHYLGKVLYNTSYEISSFKGTTHHLTRCKMKFLNFNIDVPSINEVKHFIVWNIYSLGFGKGNDFTIQINHYWSKSYSEFLQKVNRGNVYFAEDPNFIDFNKYELRNRTSDYKIFRFLLKLKCSIMNKK